MDTRSYTLQREEIPLYMSWTTSFYIKMYITQPAYVYTKHFEMKEKFSKFGLVKCIDYYSCLNFVCEMWQKKVKVSLLQNVNNPRKGNFYIYVALSILSYNNMMSSMCVFYSMCMITFCLDLCMRHIRDKTW